MLADWIIPFVYNIGHAGFRSSLLTWVFLGGLFALHRVIAAGGLEAGQGPDRRSWPVTGSR